MFLMLVSVTINCNMADNYLERKMEDLKSGKLSKEYTVRDSPNSARSTNSIRFLFPPKRILILTSGFDELLIKELLKTRSKIAVVSDDDKKGADLVKCFGIRFIKGKHQEEKDLNSAFVHLFKAWRDVDVVICNHDYYRLVEKIWITFKEKYSIPSDYSGRLIVLSQNSDEEQTFVSIYDKIAVNRITYSCENFSNAVVSAVKFLCSNDAEGIRNSLIRIF